MAGCKIVMLSSTLSHRVSHRVNKIPLVTFLIRITHSKINACSFSSLSAGKNEEITAPSTRKRKSSATSITTTELINNYFDFDEEAKKLMNLIIKAVEPILEINGYYFEDRGAMGLALKCGSKGSYTFKIDFEELILIYRSPVSGSLQYKFCPESKLWLSINDGHDLRGIITRDLIRHSMGMPNFE